jgi:hypothetical protein
MSDVIVCCRQLPSYGGARTPFHRIIGFGLYDGLTSGVAECEACGSVYRFDMIDMSADWGEWGDIRVYALAPLPPGSFDRLLDACPRPPGPDWSHSNVWVPKWSFSTEGLEAAANARVNEILDRAQPAELVIAATPWGERVLAARNLTAEDLLDIQTVEWEDDPRRLRDWIAFLGLVRESHLAG